MWSQLRLRWEARGIEPDLPDDDLEARTREIAKAIVQTLSNRAFRRPGLSAGDPYESVREQRAFDRETAAVYRENIAPEVETLRAEYVARGLWTARLEALHREPGDDDDLRELVAGLEELAAAL